jgi:hypothetical protein
MATIYVHPKGNVQAQPPTFESEWWTDWRLHWAVGTGTP